MVIFVIVAGSTKANFTNWELSNTSTDMEGDENSKGDNVNLGSGGFFPFGVSGMLSGAATCFYGFVGFDAIATTGEETRNPQKSIPIAIGEIFCVCKFCFLNIKSLPLALKLF